MPVPKWQLGSFVTDNEIQIVTGDVRLVGYARGDNYSETLDRGLLMSAAPELLEALEKLQGVRGDAFYTSKYWEQYALPAIAKARSRS